MLINVWCLFQILCIYEPNLASAETPFPGFYWFVCVVGASDEFNNNKYFQKRFGGKEETLKKNAGETREGWFV